MNRPKISQHELLSLQRHDFVAFSEASFYQLNPEKSYLHSWHIDVIASALEECRLGKLRRLIINLPPRSLKSHLASVAFPSYMLGHNPSARIICASYAQDLADKLALDSRTLMTSAFYQQLFPNARLVNRRQSISDFLTARQGYRLSTSVGGVLTGRGADIIIIDDPLKPDEALSDVQRNAVNDWFDHSLISRLDDKSSGVIIVIMQRLHEDDLVGHILRQDDWRVLSFPAIAEQSETHTVDTPYGRKSFTRKLGEALHPEREPLSVLNRLREQMGEYHFAGQYQQSPPRWEGEWLRPIGF